MSNKKVQKNGIGTKIIVETETDITGYTSLKIQYKKPDTYDEDGVVIAVGESGEWDALPEGIQTKGDIAYVTDSAGDLDVAGAMCIQSDIIIPDWAGRGKSTQLIVMDNC